MILVDCDGILSDFTQACLDLAADKFNIMALPSDCNRDPLWDAIGCPYLPPAINDAIAKAEFCYRMKPIAEGINFLRKLEETYGPDNVLVCTAPWNSKWSEQRLDWLRDKAGVKQNRVITTSRKDVCRGILIDDSVKHLVNRPYGQGYCIAQPYNSGYEGPRGSYAECLAWLADKQAQAEAGVYV